MKVVIAFAPTPAVIRTDANVCRPSCRPTPSRPARRQGLAPPEAGVERRRPDRAVPLRKRCKELRSFLGGCDALASATDRREPEVSARVDGNVAVFERAAIDDPERHERIPDRRGVLA